MAHADTLIFRPEYGTLTPTTPLFDVEGRKSFKQLAKSAFTGESLEFYSKRAAEFWLTAIASHEIWLKVRGKHHQ